MVIEKRLKKPIRNFEESFNILIRKARNDRVPLKTLLTILSGRGRLLLLIFFSLGFGQIPGSFNLLGFVICYLGLRVAFLKNYILLPRAILRKKIPSKFLIKVTQQILKRLKFLEKWTYPRYAWATHTSTIRVVNGIMISLVGIFLVLCPPVPFSSQVAFVAVFSIAIGLLNDDGIYILIGYVTAVIYCVMTLLFMKYCSLGQMIDGVKYAWIALKDRM